MYFFFTRDLCAASVKHYQLSYRSNNCMHQFVIQSEHHLSCQRHLLKVMPRSSHLAARRVCIEVNFTLAFFIRNGANLALVSHLCGIHVSFCGIQWHSQMTYFPDHPADI